MSNQAYQALPYVQKAWLTKVFLVSLVGLVIFSKNQENQALTRITRLEPYVQNAWLTRVFLGPDENYFVVFWFSPSLNKVLLLLLLA